MKVNSPSFLHSLTPVKNLTLQKQLLQFFSYFFLFLPNTLKCAIISLFFKVRTYLFTFYYGKWEVICHIILPASTTHTHTHTHTLTLSFPLVNGITSQLLVTSYVVFTLLSFTYITYMNNSYISIVES